MPGTINSLINPTWVMKQIGRRLVNNWKFTNNVLRDLDQQYQQNGAKMGYTVYTRLPQRYRVNKGQSLVPQPVVDQTVPVTLTDQANVGVEFNTSSLTMEVDNYMDKCIAPAVDVLINATDYDGLTRMYKQTFWTVGTPGVMPGSTGTLPFAANLTYMRAGVKLDNSAVPAGGRLAILGSEQQMYLAAANQAIFNPAAQISEAFREGQFSGRALGFDEWFMDQNVAVHTVGAGGGTCLVNGAGQTGSSIVSDGWTNSTLVLLEGDVIQLTDVYAVNPQSYQSTGQLQDFVVTANVTSNGSGQATIPVYPPIITNSSALQTVNTTAADNAPIKLFGSATSTTYAGVQTPQALMYRPEAYAMVMADLELPGGLWVAERISNKALGLAVRFLKDYNIYEDESPARVDILYGWKATRPEMACRVCG